MTLQELIDRECNRVLEEICAARYLRKSDVLSRSIKPHLIRARRETVKVLFSNGFRKADIARTLKRNHSMITYWLDADTRKFRRQQSAEYMKRRKIVWEARP